MKAKKAGPFGDNPPNVVFWCVACKTAHAVPYTNVRPHPPGKALWFFDENYELPTIEPSLRVFKIDGKTTDCHVVVTNGVLNYQADDPHMPNQSVPMVEFPENFDTG